MRLTRFRFAGSIVILLLAIAEGVRAEPGDGPSVTAAEHKRRTIYHSPESPGFTCWTGIWAMPDE